ncbi:MAG: SGNH/GDSL hydrolase family protein [Rhodospirillales bacterium]|nr:SGNH/GDSL hydrolase family protein [Rhodospirillales bacterium]
MGRWFVAGLCLLLFPLAIGSGALVAAPVARVACPAASLPAAHLPASRAALAAGKQLVIVALGSSSTAGAAASDPAASYPARLQKILSAALPRASISVLNRGRNGEDIGHELARLDEDVIAIRPTLVIWQVGANAALHQTPPALFLHFVKIGLASLKAAGTDVILMDNQRSPRLIASPLDEAIDHALALAAAGAGVNLFSRATLMDTWRREGFPYRDFIARDRLHQNDRGYDCIAHALATMILKSLAPDGTSSHWP